MSLIERNTLTRRTFAAGSWSGGDYTAGAATDTEIKGSWQSAGWRQLQTLSEGERVRDPRRLYTTTALQVLDQHAGRSADHVSPDGGTTWYEVRDDSDFSALLPAGSPLSHYRYLCLRVQEGE